LDCREVQYFRGRRYGALFSKPENSFKNPYEGALSQQGFLWEQCLPSKKEGTGKVEQAKQV
jgi:hypothetical protein